MKAENKMLETTFTVKLIVTIQLPKLFVMIRKCYRLIVPYGELLM